MRTAWHPLLVVLLEHLLPRAWYRLIPELQLTKEPQRVDTVIIRKRRVGAAPSPTHLVSVLDGLRDHTLVHFKGPSDALEASDALQLLGYAAQYMVLEGLGDPALLALRVIAPTLTPRFVAQLRLLGGELSPGALPGVHEGALGVFALRVVESAAAWPSEHEHLLYTVAPQYIDYPGDGPLLDDEERALFHFLAQCVARFREDPEWRTLMKDAAKVDRSYKSAWDKIVQNLPVEERLAGLAPEQRLAGLAPEHLVLALPDDALRALSDEYIATLPDDVRAKVAARRTH